MTNFAARSVVLGAKPLGVTSATQVHKLGHRVMDELGNEYTYIQANGAIALVDIVTVDGSYDCAPLTGAGVAFGVGVVAISDNHYGFVQTRGVCTADLATSTADNAVLSSITDSNGDLVSVAAVTASSTGAAGVFSVFAKALAAESGGSGSVFIL